MELAKFFQNYLILPVGRATMVLEQLLGFQALLVVLGLALLMGFSPTLLILGQKVIFD